MTVFEILLPKWLRDNFVDASSQRFYEQCRIETACNDDDARLGMLTPQRRNRRRNRR